MVVRATSDRSCCFVRSFISVTLGGAIIVTIGAALGAAN